MNDPVPSVTVLICVRNGADYLTEAIISAQRQSVPPAQVLVVDDGSRDGSAAAADAAGATVVRQPPLGLAAARNEGVRRAEGTLVAMLDADDLFVVDALQNMCAALRPRSDAIGCVGRRQHFISPELTAEPEFTGTAPPADAGPCVLPAGGLWRRESLLSEPFDTSLVTPDLDWVNRCRELGRITLLLDDVVFHRRVHRNNMSRDVEVRAAYLDVARAALTRRARRV
jgi:glycosyltransferase involved in cell wall biosynthesis